MKEINLLQAMLDEALRRVHEILDSSLPVNLYLPVSYSLQAGGKRLRPMLVLAGYSLFGDKPEEAIPAALALEIFHNFTLLHDDIMDKAEVRRNRPSVHIRFSENSAILSGDAMSFLAYRYLLQCKSDRLDALLSLFTETAIGVCEGQQLDMNFENSMEVSPDAYLEMIRLKSAVLIACALKTGGLLAGCSVGQAESLYDAGINLGLAFQLQDDLLDTYGAEEVFGKKTGGDIVTNKKTYLLVQALLLAGSGQRNELESWISRPMFERDEKISSVREIFNQLGIKELTGNKIQYYFRKTESLIESLDVAPERKEPLLYLVRTLPGRQS
jgi:geranylgeranyl diphosphate synthase type II